MPKVVKRPNEDLDQTIERFKRDVNRSGNLKVARNKQTYAKPSVAKREKLQENARKKKFNR